MLLRHQNLDAYLDTLAAGERRALFLFFPNFEERSVQAAQLISRREDIGGSSQAMVYWLQGPHPPEILDEIKTENTERVLNACRQAWSSVPAQELRYPNPEQRLFQGAVRDCLTTLGDAVDIVVDVSATPRDMLFQLFEFLFPASETWPYRVEGTEIRAIHFIYTWARDYPPAPGPELLGDLIGQHSDRRLLEILADRDLVRLVVCGAGTGHDALQAVTIAEHKVPNAKLTTDVFLFMNRNNPLRSFNQMMRHQSLIRHLRSKGRSFRTVFSVSHLASAVLNSANDAAREHNGNGAFIVGPFGPKLFGLCGYFAAREYRRISSERGMKNEIDLLNLNSAQYLTVYSLGVRETEMFSITE